MTKLNDANAIYIGANAADRIYVGGNLIWSAPEGGGAFSPTDVTGLEIWFNDTSSYTESGGEFLTLENLAASGLNDLVASGQGAPSVGTVGGKRVLSWPQTTNTKGMILASEVESKTLYIVMQYKDGVDTTFDAYNMITHPNGAGFIDRIMGALGTDDMRSDAATPWGTHQASINGAAASAQVLPMPLSIVKLQTGNASTFGVQGIGKNLNNTGAAWSWQGDMAEFLAYSNDPSPEDEASILAYLAAKWGITLA